MTAMPTKMKGVTMVSEVSYLWAVGSSSLSVMNTIMPAIIPNSTPYTTVLNPSKNTR